MNNKIFGKRRFSNGKLPAPGTNPYSAIVALLLTAIAAIAESGCANDHAHPDHVDKQNPTLITSTQPVNGLILVLHGSKSRVHAGDDIEVVEKLENVTNHVIWENFRDFDLFADELAAFPPVKGLPPAAPSDDYPFARDPHPVPMVFDVHDAPGLPQAVMTSKHFASSIAPGDVRTVTHHFTILRPGVYRFTATWESSYSADHQADLWKGSLQSNAIELTVLPKGT